MITTIPVKYVDTTQYTVEILQDQDAESPDSWGNFKILDFYGDYNNCIKLMEVK
jgi:hypothetical protein